MQVVCGTMLALGRAQRLSALVLAGSPDSHHPGRALLLGDRGPGRPQDPADPVPQEPGHDRRPCSSPCSTSRPPAFSDMARKGGALAELDLSLELTPKQEAARLAVAQARLLQLRLVLGGQIGDDPQIGPPVCVVFEGWDASGKGGAIKRLVEPLDPRHVRVAEFGAPSYDENAITSCGGSGRCCPAGEAWRCWTAPGTAASWSNGSRDSPPIGGMAARLPGDRRLRADAGRRRHDHHQVLAAPVVGRTAQAVQGAGA